MKLLTTDAFKNMHKSNPDLHVLTDAELKQVQGILLDMLADILDICNRYDINYHLTGGSALGVVRHKGFIPWDDDIDIDMSRKDMQRFIQEFEREYGSKYWVHNAETKGMHCFPGLQIRKKGTVMQGRGDPEPYECGICIDILPIENSYNNAIMRRLHGCISLFLGFGLSCRRFYANREYFMQLAKGNSDDVKKVFKTKIFLGRLCAFLSYERWVRMYDRWNARCKNENSTFVTVPTGRKHFFKETYKRSDFSEYTLGSFESLEVKIPKEIDAYLTHMYGDYKTVPPEGMREQHLLVRFSIDETIRTTKSNFFYYETGQK